MFKLNVGFILCFFKFYFSSKSSNIWRVKIKFKFKKLVLKISFNVILLKSEIKVMIKALKNNFLLNTRVIKNFVEAHKWSKWD